MNTSIDPRKNPLGLATGIVSVMFLLVCVFMYLLFFKEPYLTYKNVPFPPTISQVAPGEVIPVHVVRCNSDDVPHNYMTTRSLERINPEVGQLHYVVLPPALVSIAPGCHESDSLLNKLPDHVPSGTYRLIGTAEVQTPFRMHQVYWHSQTFEVVAKK